MEKKQCLHWGPTFDLSTISISHIYIFNNILFILTAKRNYEQYNRTLPFVNRRYALFTSYKDNNIVTGLQSINLNKEYSTPFQSRIFIRIFISFYSKFIYKFLTHEVRLPSQDVPTSHFPQWRENGFLNVIFTWTEKKKKKIEKRLPANNNDISPSHLSQKKLYHGFELTLLRWSIKRLKKQFIF